MQKKIAYITQTYKADFNECKLLSESIDRFSPSIEHYIFVNDEDFDLFKELNYGKHKVYKKSSVLPWHFFRIPWKILGHHFYVSPFSLPMREWIMQQICKLAVFDVIGEEYDAVFNIDSETVLMKPVDVNTFVKNGNYRLFRTSHTEYEVAHGDYVAAIKKFFKGSINGDELLKWNYMDMPVCFVRKNLNEMLQEIKKNSPMNSWKTWLASTYRFSENYTYGNYVVHKLGLKYHFLTEKNVFPVVQVANFSQGCDLERAIMEKMTDQSYYGVCLQKKLRKHLVGKYLDFNIVNSIIHNIWENE